MHTLLSNRLRSLGDKSSRDPYRTWFRANTQATLESLCEAAGFEEPAITMLEPEPSYGGAHAHFFYPMMAYERLVNRLPLLSGFRHTMICTARKPIGPQLAEGAHAARPKLPGSNQ